MFPFCKAGSLCSSCDVYAASCSNGNQVSGLVCNQVSGRAGNHPRRALVYGCCFVQRFRVYPSPPPPRGAGKTGRLSGDSPCATTHSLLRLPAKHRPARCYSQVTRKLPASYPQVTRKFQVYRKFIALRFSRLSKGIPYIFRATCI